MKKIIKTVLAGSACLSLVCTTGMGVNALENEEGVDSKVTSEESTSIENPMEETETSTKEDKNKENTNEVVEQPITDEEIGTDVITENSTQPIENEETNVKETPVLENMNNSPELNHNYNYNFHYVYIDSVTGQILKEYTFKDAPNLDYTKIMEEQVPEGYGLEQIQDLGWTAAESYYIYYVQKGIRSYDGLHSGSDLKEIKVKFIDAQTNMYIKEITTLNPSSFEYVTLVSSTDFNIHAFFEETGYSTNEHAWKVENDTITIYVQKKDNDPNVNGHVFSIRFLSNKKEIGKSDLIFENIDINNDQKIDYEEIQRVVPEGYRLSDEYDENDIFFKLTTQGESTFVDMNHEGVFKNFISIEEIKNDDFTDTNDSDKETSTSPEKGNQNDDVNFTDASENENKKSDQERRKSSKKENDVNTAYQTYPAVWTGIMAVVFGFIIGIIRYKKTKINR